MSYLNDLGLKYGTDKASNHHDYLHTYEKYFAEYKNNTCFMVVAGVGGYEYPERGGQCLRMWREWFTHAVIIGLDVYEKSFVVPGVSILKMSQIDERISDVCKGANIFIDDASHINPLTLDTFHLVWPVLAPGGIYVIEDIETSYGTHDNWASGAPLADYDHPTAINLCRSLIDSVNAQYSGADNMQIDSIHFHKNIVFIKKK